jgi:hypothetical protein
MNLVQLAEQFLRLSGELDATRDAMKRLLLNGAGETSPIPFRPNQAVQGEGAASADGQGRRWQ